ncbi:MAG: AraC family transcriptional regulator [Defluviitaleaceae bacterium]|nr:AraC family transcriptional regulator [Defluviitaleaceae bacterium]
MDWLKGMNDVIEYIEENLTRPIKYESLSRIVGCSVYEFSRIFSFMAGISVSEYIRRRRLSQAVFDIQNGIDKIIDIALRYCYESPTTFARAFKELHGTTPSSARRTGISLKTYPSIAFVLTIKGVNEMDFRIEKKESFQIMGLSGQVTDEFIEVTQGDGSKVSMPNLWKEYYEKNYLLCKNHYSAPFWEVAAFFLDSDQSLRYFNAPNGSVKAILGAEYKGKIPEGADLTIETIPAATWAVFTIRSITGRNQHNEAYTRILTEWLPTSQYRRDELAPNLDVYPIDKNGQHPDYVWEVWLPILNK